MSPAYAWAAMAGWFVAFGMVAVIAPTWEARRWARATLLTAVITGLVIGVLGGLAGTVLA